MQPLRRTFGNHAPLWIAVLLLAVLVRAAVPSGFMVAPTPDRLIEVKVCNGHTGPLAKTYITVPGKPAPAPENDAAKDAKCAFSGLSMSALGGTPPVFVGIALAAMVLLGLAPLVSPSFSLGRYLRPPLRAPPAAI
ncbi:DUF2946 family protein [Qipengyuania sp. JC766]|uniref:DUF2946 family protein n=1 Tax=Qipengyuania sp. JC766 TaxID=3232139 RepID=UPI00345B36EC